MSSDLFDSSISVMSFWPISILVAGVLGSAHCVGMCGPLIAAVARNPGETIAYHLGRMVSYVSFGLIAGALGQATLGLLLPSMVENGSSGFSWPLILAWGVRLSMAFSLFYIGYKTWKGEKAYLFHFSLPNTWFGELMNVRSSFRTFSLGFLSAFLPCAWLQTFVFGALATESAYKGGLMLFVFWMSTLPALSMGPILLMKFLSPLQLKAPKLVAGLLFFAGFSMIFIKSATLMHLGKMGADVICH